MVVLPSDKADTSPDSDTDATLGFVDVQDKPSKVALEGDTVAFRSRVSPITNSALGWLIATDTIPFAFSLLPQADRRKEVNANMAKKRKEKCLLISVICSKLIWTKINNLYEIYEIFAQNPFPDT